MTAPTTGLGLVQPLPLSAREKARSSIRTSCGSIANKKPLSLMAQGSAERQPTLRSSLFQTVLSAQGSHLVCPEGLAGYNRR